MSATGREQYGIARGTWAQYWRTHVNTAFRRQVAYGVIGGLVGLLGGAVYFAITPDQYDSNAIFVVAPNSLASSTTGSGPGGSGLDGAAASILGGGSFSEVDVYMGQIRSHDFVAGFLDSHPDVIKAYGSALSDGSAGANGKLQPAVADRFRSGYMRLTPTASTRIFQLTVSAPNPKLAASVGKQLLASMNDMIRKSAIAEHQGRINFLREQLATAENVMLRESITILATEELRTLTLVAGSEDYGVKVIDSPSFSAARAWPRRSIVFGLGLINGVLAGAFLYWLRYSRRWF